MIAVRFCWDDPAGIGTDTDRIVRELAAYRACRQRARLVQYAEKNNAA